MFYICVKCECVTSKQPNTLQQHCPPDACENCGTREFEVNPCMECEKAGPPMYTCSKCMIDQYEEFLHHD